MQRLPAWYARNQLYDKPRIDIVAILNSEYQGRQTEGSWGGVSTPPLNFGLGG